jgi:hypothetical protein
MSASDLEEPGRQRRTARRVHALIQERGSRELSYSTSADCQAGGRAVLMLTPVALLVEAVDLPPGVGMGEQIPAGSALGDPLDRSETRVE